MTLEGGIVALTPSEIELIEELKRRHDARAFMDERHLRYFLLKQRVEHLGMAIPPTMRRFLVVANWPRVVVRTITGRQKVRSLILPGQETADPRLRAIWDANNLSAHTKMFRTDKYVLGKPSDHQKIDVLMADVLAYEAACDARSAGWLPSSGPKYIRLPR